MISKRPKVKGLATAGPKRNKQRITLLSAREERAAVTGGAIDDRIPEAAIKQRLRDEPEHVFDVDAVKRAIARHVGYARGFHTTQGVVQPPRLEPSEVAQQARETGAVVAELIRRLDHMHPDIAALADDALYRSREETLWEMQQRVVPDLYRIQAAVVHAAEAIQKQPSRTGPKSSPYAIARAGIASALRENSEPAMAAKPSVALAADLLEICGVKSPRQ